MIYFTIIYKESCLFRFDPDVLLSPKGPTCSDGDLRCCTTISKGSPQVQTAISNGSASSSDGDSRIPTTISKGSYPKFRRWISKDSASSSGFTLLSSIVPQVQTAKSDASLPSPKGSASSSR